MANREWKYSLSPVEMFKDAVQTAGYTVVGTSAEPQIRGLGDLTFELHKTNLSEDKRQALQIRYDNLFEQLAKEAKSDDRVGSAIMAIKAAEGDYLSFI